VGSSWTVGAMCCELSSGPRASRPLSATSAFLSEEISHQQPANSTFLSEQTSTSHQPPTNRTGCQFHAEDSVLVPRWFARRPLVFSASHEFYTALNDGRKLLKAERVKDCFLALILGRDNRNQIRLDRLFQFSLFGPPNYPNFHKYPCHLSKLYSTN
jgi:hypothetical protein